MKSKVSIIMPIFNAEKYLKRSIESVLNQRNIAYELILINDGSTDCSKSICSEYSRKYESIIYLEKQNTGVSDTRNKGIEQASGEYLYFLDADDFIDPNYLSDLLQGSEKYDLIIGNYMVAYDSKKQVLYENQTIDISFDELREKILDGDNSISGFLNNKLFKKKYISNNIFFNTNIHISEDTLFILEYLERINSFRIVNTDSYQVYCINDSSATMGDLTDRSLSSLYANKELLKLSKTKKEEKIIYCRIAKASIQLLNKAIKADNKNIINISCESLNRVDFKNLSLKYMKSHYFLALLFIKLQKDMYIYIYKQMKLRNKNL